MIFFLLFYQIITDTNPIQLIDECKKFEPVFWNGRFISGYLWVLDLFPSNPGIDLQKFLSLV